MLGHTLKVFGSNNEGCNISNQCQMDTDYISNSETILIGCIIRKC